MNRDDARDLLPLYAGGDLDDEAHTAVAALLADDADLTEECSAWEELDAMLTDALTPADAAEPDWGALLAEPEPKAEPVVVRRHCPFCKDDLPAEAVVFCGTCATPHHEPCFAENQGCSLLGCGGTESVTLDSGRSQVCATCSRSTPADAPFCAWCGAAAEGVERPRHEQVIPLPAPPTWRPLLAAAALLLSMGLGIGGLFGLQQRPMVESIHRSMKKAGFDVDWSAWEQDGQLFLAELRTAQQLYRDHDLDTNGKADLAPDLEGLIRTLKAAAAEQGGDPDRLLVLPHAERWTIHYRLARDGRRFAVLLVPKPVREGDVLVFQSRPLLLTASGKIRAVPRAVGVHPQTLEPILQEGVR